MIDLFRLRSISSNLNLCLKTLTILIVVSNHHFGNKNQSHCRLEIARTTDKMVDLVLMTVMIKIISFLMQKSKSIV